jgi:hypothetical protein
MKRRKLVFLGILMLFVAPIVLAEGQQKEISVDEAMKYFCTTWINPTYYDNDFYTGIKIMKKDGTFEWYNNETSKSPTNRGTYKIEKSWIDKDGNAWLNVILDEGLWKKYLLAKISDDGNTLECAFEFKAYPTVDPETWPYFIMHKK